MKRFKSWTSLLMLAIIVLWFVFGIVPFLKPNISCITIRLMGVSFAAATALFTGIAFGVAYHNLFKQQESIKEQQASFKKQQESIDKQQETLIKQINLSVFTDTMRIVMLSRKYNQCREYIYSNNFKDDKERVRKILHPDNEKYAVSLIDFNNANQSLSRTEKKNEKDKNLKKELSDSHEKIRFFCMIMEYLGVIVDRENAAKDLILEYYGHTITETYDKLNSLILATRKIDDYKDIYRNYSKLNEKAIEYQKNNKK